MTRFLPLVLFTLLAPAAWAQGLVLWKVSNDASPTVVPSYEGQPSPFPHAPQQEEVSTTVDPLLEAARLARLAALEKAEKVLSGKDAFRPELAVLQVQGRVENAAGETKVLVANQWIGMGRKLNVRLTVAAEAAGALAELRKYDADAANALENKMNLRLQQSPFVQLTITAITPEVVELTSEYGTHRVPIPRTP